MALEYIDEKGEKRVEGDKVILLTHSESIVKAVDRTKRTLTIVGSDESVDRDGDIIMTNGWMLDRYKKNPVFLWGHDRYSPPIGAATKVERKRNPWRMLFTIKYPQEGVYPFADVIFSLFAERIMNASSVSFMPYEWDDMKREDLIGLIGEDNISPMMWRPRKFKRQELLELSAVSVPANPNAVQADDSGKSLDEKSLAVQSYVRKNFEGVVAIEALMANKTPDVPDDVKERLDNELGEIFEKGLEVVEDTETSIQVPHTYNLLTEGEKVLSKEELEKLKGIVSIEEIKALDEELAIELQRLFDQGLIGVKFDSEGSKTESESNFQDVIRQEIKDLRQMIESMGASRQPSSGNANESATIDTIMSDDFKSDRPKRFTDSKKAEVADEGRSADVIKQLKSLVEILSKM